MYKSHRLQHQQHRPQLLERVKRRQLNTPTQQEQHSCCYWHWEPAWLYWSLQGPLKDVSWQTISTPDSGWSYIFTQSCSQMGLRQCCTVRCIENITLPENHYGEVHKQSIFSSANGTIDAWLTLLDPLNVGSCKHTEPGIEYRKGAELEYGRTCNWVISPARKILYEPLQLQHPVQHH